MDLPPSVIEYGGAALLLVLVALLLRWTFGTQNARRPPVNDPADPVNDGLLEEVSRVPSQTAAQELRRRLGGEGIRSTVARAADGGYRLLVFPADLPDARVVLGRGERE
ncbi:MAG: hypothetical protein L0I76_34285 [Pseudonocardia sp.]|nr:hypothetical protein [Pseudonocardia sp.]